MGGICGVYGVCMWYICGMCSAYGTQYVCVMCIRYICALCGVWYMVCVVCVYVVFVWYVVMCGLCVCGGERCMCVVCVVCNVHMCVCNREGEGCFRGPLTSTPS